MIERHRRREKERANFERDQLIRSKKGHLTVVRMSCCSAPMVTQTCETLLSKCEIPIIDLAHMGECMMDFFLLPFEFASFARGFLTRRTFAQPSTRLARCKSLSALHLYVGIYYSLTRFAGNGTSRFVYERQTVFPQSDRCKATQSRNAKLAPASACETSLWLLVGCRKSRGHRSSPR